MMWPCMASAVGEMLSSGGKIRRGKGGLGMCFSTRDDFSVDVESGVLMGDVDFDSRHSLA